MKIVNYLPAERIKVIKFQVKSKRKEQQPAWALTGIFISVNSLKSLFHIKNMQAGGRQGAAHSVHHPINPRSSTITSNQLPVSPKISSAYPTQSPCTKFSSPIVLSLSSIRSKSWQCSFTALVGSLSSIAKEQCTTTLTAARMRIPTTNISAL